MNEAASLYRLLGEAVRLRLLRVLARERLNVTELTAVLGLAQSGVSRHLGLLRDAGLVAEAPAGGFTYYRLGDAAAHGRLANGLRSDAIHHALAAEDFERAACLIELARPAMALSYQSSTWLGWVKALPDELIRAQPVLSMGYAWGVVGEWRIGGQRGPLARRRALAGYVDRSDGRRG